MQDRNVRVQKDPLGPRKSALSRVSLAVPLVMRQKKKKKNLRGIEIRVDGTLQTHFLDDRWDLSMVKESTLQKKDVKDKRKCRGAS